MASDYSVVDDIKLVKINVLKIPRKQSTFVKYRCREPFCAKLIRQDKWPAHCKKEHSFKFRRWVYYFDNISVLINCGLSPTDAALLLGDENIDLFCTQPNNVNYIITK